MRCPNRALKTTLTPLFACLQLAFKSPLPAAFVVCSLAACHSAARVLWPRVLTQPFLGCDFFQLGIRRLFGDSNGVFYLVPTGPFRFPYSIRWKYFYLNRQPTNSLLPTTRRDWLKQARDRSSLVILTLPPCASQTRLFRSDSR